VDSATWIRRLNEAGVPCGQIYSIDQVFADPQVRHLEMVQEIDSPHYHPLRVVAQPVRLSRVRGEITRRPPERGEHTNDVLASLGYKPEEIVALRGEGII
jgi:crotonobetainyl-CoA:carnitine CoA-transferase CaiB-like acyl-CoA transferase